MYIQVVLDPHVGAGQPSNHVVIKNGEEGIFTVDHIVDNGDGIPVPVQKMTISTTISPEERTMRRMRAAYQNNEAVRLVVDEHDEELGMMLGA